MLVLFLACLLHLIDRQVESSSRTEFLWQTKLSSEEEGVETMRGINKVGSWIQTKVGYLISRIPHKVTNYEM